MAGVLSIDGTLILSRQPNGTLDITLANTLITVTVSGTNVFRLAGNASFTISPATGLHLVNFKITGFDLFGVAGLDIPTGAGTTPQGGPAAGAGVPPVTLPVAHLADPVAGAVILPAALDHVDVVFTDLSGVGIDPNTIRGDELEVTLNGVALTVSAPTPVPDKPNTWRYLISGALTDGVVNVTFKGGSFADKGGVTNAASSERIYLSGTGKPGPVAQLASPGGGETLTADALNARRYIDVTFQSLDGSPIDKSSITDAGDEFTLTGPGVADAKLLGAPLLIAGTDAGATTVTYRYFLGDKTPTNTIDLFQAGDVTVTFLDELDERRGRRLQDAGGDARTSRASCRPSGSTRSRRARRRRPGRCRSAR